MTLASIRSCDTFALLNMAFFLIARVVSGVHICAWKAPRGSIQNVNKMIIPSTMEYD